MEKKPYFGKIVLYVLGSLILLFTLIYLGVTAVYCRFFMGAESKFLVPGLDSPFVQQGLDFVQEKNLYLVSGYMDDGTASRIYIRENGGDVRFVELKDTTGGDYSLQCGGICHNGRYVYVAGKGGLEVFTLDDILDGGNATVIGRIETGFDVGYCAFYEGYLLAGQENAGPIAVFQSGDGGVFGITRPVAAIAAPENVRGVCVTGRDELALSSSEGWGSSQLSYYSVATVAAERTVLVGVEVPLVSLQATHQVSMPPMAREIHCRDGQVYVMFESAADKNFFGQFIRGYQVFAYEREGEN